MSKNVALFVDVANLYYSARGQDVDVDYVALLKYATKGRDLIRAYAYSGLDPENENQRKFIDFLGKNGYSVLTKDIRKFGDGRVKANLDIELVVDLFRVAHRMDIAVIVSGDGDFAPAIVALQQSGVRCEVISFRPNTSSDLMAVADEFVDVMKIAGIGRGSKESGRSTKTMSTPEMPAKEVVPEFGFRDASPAVAAAALAAIREGKDGRSGASRTRGGRGRARPATRAAEPAASSEPAAPVSETEPAASGEPRRRHRRRGGRGRGRGRGRATEGATAAPAGDGEIGWTELDDASQLDELGFSERDENREYSFEEADAATLAELGISADEAPASEASADEKPKRTRRPRSTSAASTSGSAEASADEKPKRTRRPRSTSAASTSGGAEASADEKPKRTRRPRSTSAASTSGGAEASADEKPKRTRRPRSSGSSGGGQGAAGEGSQEASAGDEAGQGIWQRFRSGRTGSR